MKAGITIGHRNGRDLSDDKLDNDYIEWRRLERIKIAEEMRKLADRIEHGDIHLVAGEPCNVSDYEGKVR